MMSTAFTPRFFCAFMLVIYMSLSANKPISLQEKYIEQFKFVAINEMERSGIPASIKMAQALIESQSGQSELAIQANNHFGIKCKNTWTGNIYYYEDDDRDENGQIIASCFRSYSSAMDSYRDHSDFLLNRPRYKELFDLPKDDYKSWAYGLKRCGYATDPIYAERLIKIIQKYNLDLLDNKIEVPVSVEQILVSTINTKAISEKQIKSETGKVILVSNTIPKKFVKNCKTKKQKKLRKKRI